MQEVFSDSFVLNQNERYKNAENPLLELVKREMEEDFLILEATTGKVPTKLSLLELHKTNNVKTHILNIKSQLKVGELFYGTFFGSENLYDLQNLFVEAELRVYGGFSPRFLPTIEIKTAGMLLQNCGFSGIVVDSRKFKITFQNIKECLNFIRKSREANCLLSRDTRIRRKLFSDILDKYNGEFTCTFDILFFWCFA